MINVKDLHPGMLLKLRKSAWLCAPSFKNDYEFRYRKIIFVGSIALLISSDVHVLYREGDAKFVYIISNNTHGYINVDFLEKIK